MAEIAEAPWRSRRSRILLVVAIAVLVGIFLPVPARTSYGAPATDDVGAVTKSKTVSRTHLIDGQNVEADTRTVTIHVDQTKNLHDRQAIQVSWSGAHPTGNGAGDPNSPAGAEQEYPLVLMECRGVDSPNVPPAQRIAPQTCWSQTPVERYLASAQLLFPPWRVDRYATHADRVKVIGAPRPYPAACPVSLGYPEHWLPFVAADGVAYAGGPANGCAGIAPEQSLTGSTLALPGNTTYGFTDPDGTGEAKFDVWSALTNTSLGCGPTVPCALVAVPIEGISCDIAAAGLPRVDQPRGQDAIAAEAACESAGNQSVPTVAVAGKLWWSASNWRNRITVPLQFGPLPTTSCSSGGSSGIDIYGSELMTEATQQWSTKFCLDSGLFPIQHVQTGETQARNLLVTGNTDAAFTSAAPDGGWGSPVVSAPVAMTGFSIGYDVDDGDRHEYSKLKLDGRLLAKLLTESYPAIQAIQNGWSVPPPDGSGLTDYTALAHNPINITQDPEFIALNPTIGERSGGNYGAATLLMLSSDSDVVRALTSYIDADPEARAWLDGRPDPWGMVVNPHYEGIRLPVDNWPLLDDYEPREIYNENNVCLLENPVPYLPLVASPMIRLSLISLNLQYSIQQSQVVCQGAAGSNPKLVANGRQTIGFRFMLGITSLADAAKYRINSAALQNHVAGTAPARFTDATGRSFAAPTTTSLRAAADLLTPDAAAGTWTLPYDKLTGSGDADAYPGAMLVNAAVPTEGLPKGEAGHYATFLRFAAGAGQTPGSGPGQLPPGYLPLTGGNGLAAQQHYTEIAAQYVAAQNGAVPSLTDPEPVSRPPHSPGSSPASSPARTTTPHGGGGNPPPLDPGGSSAPAASGSPTPTPAPSTSTVPVGNTSSPVATAPTQELTAPLIGTILPILALVGLAAGFLAPTLSRFTGRRT